MNLTLHIKNNHNIPKRVTLIFIIKCQTIVN